MNAPTAATLSTVEDLQAMNAATVADLAPLLLLTAMSPGLVETTGTAMIDAACRHPPISIDMFLVKIPTQVARV